MNYNQNRSWSDEFMPSVKSILGQVIIEASSFKQDTEEAFDLITLPSTKKIACRVRDYDKYSQYMDEFTVRSRSRYGKKTEIHKIAEGFGDWMFYGFGKNKKVLKYSVIDLDIFRENLDSIAPLNKKNWDGTEFSAFKLGLFPSNIIIKSNIDIQFGLEEISDYLKPFPQQI